VKHTAPAAGGGVRKAARTNFRRWADAGPACGRYSRQSRLGMQADVQQVTWRGARGGVQTDGWEADNNRVSA
jgi:hypothetical protein